MLDSETLPTITDIRVAHKRITPFIHRTPIMTSQCLNTLAGAKIFFKCENLQKTGSFKIRGTTNAVSWLTPDQLVKGVATHSSGNHAAALACAATSQKSKAYIVMPRNAPNVKKTAVRSYGGEIIECEPTLQARETELNKVAERCGAYFVPPSNHPHIIAAQGTAFVELFEDVGECDYVIVSVGGGGLLSGTGIASSHLSPNTQVIAAEPSGADDAYRSFYAGYIIPSEHPTSIADGLLTSLGSLTFAAIQRYVADILTVDDDLIRQAMRLIWERMKIVIEPSAAVPLAVIIANPKRFVDKRVSVIISGGNLDLAQFRW